MKPLPFPVRIAAGLVAISLEHARDLSRLVITFPVTAAGHALQTPRRVQQKVMELAIKGDCLLDRLFSEEEQPNSATFDEHEPLRHDHASIVTERRPVRRPSPVPTDEDVLMRFQLKNEEGKAGAGAVSEIAIMPKPAL